MTPPEALALLVLASQFDPAILPATAEDRHAKATAWAAVLAGVPLDEGRAAVLHHYSTSTERLLPVHVLRGVQDRGRSDAERHPAYRPWSQVKGDLDALTAADSTRE